MITRVSVLAVSAFLGLTLCHTGTVAAQDQLDPGYREAMIAFLTIQEAAAAIEDQMTFAIAQQTLGSIAASGIEITAPMQDIVFDVARTSLGSRFGDVQFLADLYAPIYAKHYSEAELRELTAFWQSPLGKKTLAAMPKLTEGSAVVLQEASAKFIADFETALEKRLEEADLEITP